MEDLRCKGDIGIDIEGIEVDCRRGFAGVVVVDKGFFGAIGS